MELIIAILVAYGITNIVTQGTIFYAFREWFAAKMVTATRFKGLYGSMYKLLNCPMCFGFWVGVLVGAFCGPFPALNVIFNGALYSGTTWIIYCLTQFLGQGYDPARTVNVQFQTPVEVKKINNNDDKQLPTNTVK